MCNRTTKQNKTAKQNINAHWCSFMVCAESLCDNKINLTSATQRTKVLSLSHMHKSALRLNNLTVYLVHRQFVLRIEFLGPWFWVKRENSQGIAFSPWILHCPGVSGYVFSDVITMCSLSGASCFKITLWMHKSKGPYSILKWVTKFMDMLPPCKPNGIADMPTRAQKNKCPSSA